MAYDVAQAMSFERHEELINLFFNEMQREPLEGFRKVSLEQVAAADREVHVRMAEKTRGGLTRDAQGGLPLDGPLRDVIASSEVRWLLMPMPKRAPVRNQETAKKQEGDWEAEPKSATKENASQQSQCQPECKEDPKGPNASGFTGRCPDQR